MDKDCALDAEGWVVCGKGRSSDRSWSIDLDASTSATLQSGPWHALRVDEKTRCGVLEDGTWECFIDPLDAAKSEVIDLPPLVASDLDIDDSYELSKQTLCVVDEQGRARCWDNDRELDRVFWVNR